MKTKKSIAFIYITIFLIIIFCILFSSQFFIDEKIVDLKNHKMNEEIFESKKQIYLIRLFEEQSFPPIVEKSKEFFIIFQEKIKQNFLSSGETEKYCRYNNLILWYDKNLEGGSFEPINCFPDFEKNLFRKIVNDKISKNKHPHSNKQLQFTFSSEFEGVELKITSVINLIFQYQNEKNNFKINRTKIYNFNLKKDIDFFSTLKKEILNFKNCLKNTKEKTCISNFGKISNEKFKTSISSDKTNKNLYEIKINFKSFEIVRYLFI